MKPITRRELLDLPEYERIRDQFRGRVIAMKRHRRIDVGPNMTFIFENRDTVLFQIQEMLRTERISQEKAILHELETYNPMVPRANELYATLMIEVEDKDERRRLLDALTNLGKHVSLLLGDHAARGTFELQPGEDPSRLPAVNYVRFRVGPKAADILRDTAEAVTLRVDHPAYRHEHRLTAAERDQLASDLEEPS